MSNHSSNSRYQVPGLDRALSIMELLNEHPEGMLVNEIAEFLDLPTNSVYRIMQTLQNRAYARKTPMVRAMSSPKNFYHWLLPWPVIQGSWKMHCLS